MKIIKKETLKIYPVGATGSIEFKYGLSCGEVNNGIGMRIHGMNPGGCGLSKEMAEQIITYLTKYLPYYEDAE